MVINGRWVMSEEEIARHQADALLECRRAKQGLSLLLATAGQMSKRFYRVAHLLGDLKASVDTLHGPAVGLLQLPEMEYGETQNLAAIKALANSVVLALKHISETTEHARALGVDE